MSRTDLIDAYRNGRIDRRVFIRGMVGIGMSVSLATALADQVRAAPAPGAGFRAMRAQDDTYDDLYEEPEVESPAEELPSTGIESQNSASSWARPLAVIGAGAALAAGAMRRLKGSEVKPE